MKKETDVDFFLKNAFLLVQKPLKSVSLIDRFELFVYKRNVV